MTAHSAPRPAPVAPWRSTVSEVAPEDPVRAFVAGWASSGQGFLWWRPADGFALVGTGALLSHLPHGGRPFPALGAWWAEVRSACRRDAPAAADPATGPLLFCGVAFDPADERAATDPYWRSFPPVAAVLPARMTTLRAGRAWLTRNVADAGASSAPASAPDPAPAPDSGAPSALAARPPAGAPIPAVSDLPDADVWARRVRWLTDAFARGEAEKVVLARCKRVLAPGPFSVDRALRRLAADYAGSTVFAAGWGDRCFLGATPELLVSVRGTAVRSASLAGTRPRGRTPAEDRALGAELLASEKDRREHRFVVDAVAAGLRPLCRRLDVAPAPTLLHLPNVQHMLTEVAAQARAPESLLALAERLHPTPAVGGVPRAAAMAAIRRLEARARGWYAGTLGWVDGSGDGDFVVALRSGVLRGNSALLYAGCGVVPGSDPAAEWIDTEVKFAPLLAALGATPA